MFKKKLGIVGWWKGENEGDNYIKFCLKKFFKEDFSVDFISTPFKINKKKLEQLNKLDYLIIGGGGLFAENPPPPFDTFDQWGQYLKIPLSLLGIGIQKINCQYEQALEMIIKRSKFVLVRDIESRLLLEKYTKNISVAPDLSFLYPRNIIQKNNKNLKIGVNLRVWNFDQERTYDDQLWVNAINRLQGEKITVPLSSKRLIDDSSVLRKIDGSVNKRFNINLYRDMGVMIGMRLHSLIFAVQNNIPVIGIAYTPKIERFFNALGKQEFCLKINDNKRLQNVYNKVLEDRINISRSFAAYTLMAQHDIMCSMREIKQAMICGG